METKGDREWVDYAMNLLKYYLQHNPKRIGVSYITSSYIPDNIGKIFCISICEHNLNTKTYSSWQERVHIMLREKFVWRSEDGSFHSLEEYLSDIPSSIRHIDICAKIKKRLNSHQFIVSNFENSFLLRRKLFTPANWKYVWIGVYGEDYTFENELKRISKNEALAYMI